jgi:hypothetical protein
MKVTDSKWVNFEVWLAWLIVDAADNDLVENKGPMYRRSHRPYRPGRRPGQQARPDRHSLLGGISVER